MTIKYVKITAAPSVVKSSDQGVNVKTPSPGAVHVSEPGFDVNVIINGLPGDSRPQFEPLFKYVSDDYRIITNFGWHFTKQLLDLIDTSDSITIRPLLAPAEDVLLTDDFDGMAETDDDQYATFTKVVNEMEVVFEYFGMEPQKPFEEALEISEDAPLLTIDKGVADVLGDYVEQRVFNLLQVRESLSEAADEASLEPNVARHDVLSELDTLSKASASVFEEPVPVSVAEDGVAVHPNIGVADATDMSDTYLFFTLNAVLREVMPLAEATALALVRSPISDTSSASDGGTIQIQDYFAEDFVVEDYVGSTYTF